MQSLFGLSYPEEAFAAKRKLGTCQIERSGMENSH
jgi:hypothetical protein